MCLVLAVGCWEHGRTQEDGCRRIAGCRPTTDPSSCSTVVANCLLTTCVRSCRFCSLPPMPNYSAHHSVTLFFVAVSHCLATGSGNLETSYIRHRSTDLLLSIALMSSFQLFVNTFQTNVSIPFFAICVFFVLMICKVGFPHQLLNPFLRLLCIW